MAARQNVPSGYMWDGTEALKHWFRFGKTFLCIVSYCWLSREHPDPKQFHLNRLATIFSKLKAFWGMPEFAVMIDFCSLWQGDRLSVVQKKQLNEGLSEINTAYGHRAVTSIKLMDVPDNELRKYEDRGWTLYESIAIDAKLGDWNRWTFQNFDPNEAPDDAVTFFLLFTPKSLRPLLTPLDFKKELQTRSRRVEGYGHQLFTNSKDNVNVPAQYAETYRRFTETTILAYDNVGWGDAQVRALCKVLPDCDSLEHLQLMGNDIGMEGARELARVLPSVKRLRFLSLHGNRVCKDRGVLTDLRKAWGQKEKHRPYLGLDADLSPEELDESRLARMRAKQNLQNAR